MDDHHTHISARVPGEEGAFLINPYGHLFRDITPESLVKVGMDGHPVAPTPHDVNPAGFTIHSAVHMGRPDAGCVHTHTVAGVAVSSLACGLQPVNQWALQFYNRVAYHDYEGIALDLDERERLVADLGQQNAMILRNHGLLTVGATVAEAFILMLNLDRACRVQLAIQSTGQATYPVSAQVSEKTARQYASGDTNRLPGSPDPSEREWRALLKLVEPPPPAPGSRMPSIRAARLNGARRFFPAAPAPSPGEPHEPTRLSDLERRHGRLAERRDRPARLGRGARNGVLNIAVQPEPPGLMLGIVQNGPTQMIGGQIYESLLRYDDKLEPMPGLAASWTVNDAATVYTFTLKQGVQWHDGKPFNAHDVVFSVDQFLRKTHARLRAGLAFVDSIKALDEHTVEFRLPRPFGPFLGLFEVGTMPMVPRHIYEGTDYLNNPANNTPIGTGPYKFKEWRRGSYIQLVRNEQYHEAGLPSVDTLYFHVIPDAASRAAAFESGKLDVLPGGTVEYFDIARLKALQRRDHHQGLGILRPAFLHVAQQPPSGARRRARAPRHYVRAGPRGHAQRGLVRLRQGRHRAVQQQRALLHRPGHALSARRGARQTTAQGSRLQGSDAAPAAAALRRDRQRYAEIARQNLAEVGIKLEMTATDVAGWSEKTANWDYDIAFCYLYQYGDAALGVSRNYLTSTIAKGSPWNNVEGYSNPKVDELFERGAQEADPQKRRALYEEVQRILVDEAPVAWLLELQFPTLYRNNIKNLINSGIGLNDSLARATLA